MRRYASPIPSPGPSVKTGKASDRTAVGSCPYNVSAGQRTKELRHFLPFYGSKTPRYLRQNSDLRCTESQAVQGATDSAASPAKLHSQENVQITEG